MNEALRLSKKAFTWGVVATTIAWSVGVAALPLSAAAAMPTTGALIKGSLPAVYYYSSNGKRYVFPDPKAYHSWYPDFSNVQTISDADLASISIGGNVLVRPGTNLIKIQSDPKTYAVEPGGVLRWVTSEAIAKTLWGDAWGTRVVDISDSLFPNYKSGSDITTAAYPAGSVVKSGTDYWYLDATSKRKITADGMTANWFRTEYVANATIDLSGLTTGTDITVNEPALTDVSQLATSGSVTPSGSGLTVAAASDNPAGVTVVSDSDSTNTVGQALIGALKLHFTAAADGAVTVTGLKLTRGGISADSDLQDVYLFDGDGFGTLLAKAGAISSGKVSFSDSSGLFTVPAGGSKDIFVRYDLAKDLSAGNLSAGKTISFSLAAADVTTSGTGTMVSGSATGATFTVASVSDLGYIGAQSINPSAAITVDPQSNYELWRFKLVAHDENMLVKMIRVKNVGSISTGDIQNFKLYDGGTQIGTTIASLDADNNLVFDFSGMTGGGLAISSGQTKQLSLRGDIVGGTNRTFRFTIREATDIVAYDTSYNVYSRPLKDDSTGWALVEPNSSGTGVDTTISTGTLTIQRASDSPSTNVPDGATNVLLAKFTFTAAGEDVKVDSLPVYCSSNDSALVLKNWKTVFDGSQVGTTDTTQTCDGVSANANTFTFGNSFVVPAGTTKNLEVYGDLTDSTVAAGDTLSVSLASGSANAEGKVSLTSISTSSSSGNLVTVKGGAVVTTEDTAFTDRTVTNPTGVLGATGVTIGQFVVTGGGEDSDINQIVLKDDVSGSNMSGTFQNLKLWVANGSGGWTQVGQTFGSLTNTNGTTYTFSPSSTIRVLAGGTQVFRITADIKTGGTVITNDGVVYPSSVSATGVTTGTDTSDTNGTNAELQNVYIVTNGNLAVFPDSGTPVRATQVLGTTGQELARFDLKANQNEDINVTKVVISDIMTGGGAAAATGTLKNLKLVDAVTGVQYGGVVASLSSDATHSTSSPIATFDNISNLTVPKNGVTSVKVVADLTNYTDGGVSSSSHRLAIRPSFVDGITDTGTTALSYLSIAATGKDSGFSISGDSLDFNANSTNSNTDTFVLGNYMDVFRTKITIAKSADVSGGLSTGSSAQTVAKFVVTNSANVDSQAANLALMNLDIGTTISNTHTAASTDVSLYVDSDSSGNLIASSNGCASVSTICNYSSTGWTDAQVTNTDIAAGGSRSYIVKMYTSDAASQKNLTVGLANGDILWSDGVTTGISIVDSLPVAGVTFSY